MAGKHLDLAWQQIERLFGTPEAAEDSDGQLLLRLATQRDEAALQWLMRRHGPMVLGVCRRVLGDAHEAEDAFQATFLILFRKAASLDRSGSLAPWLYTVACRLAWRARAHLAKRRASEREVASMRAPTTSEMGWEDVRPVLDEEMQRLPAHYRAPLILCYLEGKSNEEAARELRWPTGSISYRLARGREMLRARLERRGIALSTAALTAGLAEHAAAAVPGPLLDATAKLMLAGAAGRALTGQGAALACILADELFWSMWVKKVALTLLAMLVLVTAGTAIGTAMYQAASADQSSLQAENPVPPPAAPAEKPLRTDRHGDPLPPGAIARLGTLRFRHGGEVNSVGLAAGNQIIISGSADGVRLWDARNGTELRLLPGYRMAVSPDGKLLAYSSLSGGTTITLVDVASGQQVHQFQRARAPHVLTFSPDGKLLAAGSNNSNNQNQVSLWEVATGKEIAAPPMGAKFDYVHHLAFSPDSKLLATAGETDGSVRLWELASGKQVTPFKALKFGGTEVVAPCVFAPDGKTFVSAGKWLASGKVDQAIHIWEVASGKELLRFQASASVGTWSVAYSPDGGSIATGHGDGSIRIWEAATGKELRLLDAHRSVVNGLAFSADGKLLSSASSDKTVRLWDMETGQAIHPTSGHQGMVTGLAVSADGKTVLSASFDRTVRLWDLKTGEELGQFAHPTHVRAIALAPDGKTVASKSWSSGSKDAHLHLWDLAGGKELWQLSERPGSLALAFSPDGQILASGGFLAMHLRDAATGKELRQAMVRKEQASMSSIPFISFAPDGKTFAWSNSAYSRLSETATGKELRDFAIYRAANSLASITSGRFSPDGRTLLLNSEEVVRLWDVASLKELRQFRTEPHWSVSSLALSPDGKTLATANLMGTIHLWEVASGKVRRELKGHVRRSHPATPEWSPAHQGSATTVAWSADGRWLVTGGEDTTILVWDVAELTLAGRSPPAGRLSGQDLNGFWADLAGEDAGRAWQAAGRLRAVPGQSVALFQERLRPAARPDAKLLARLVADLDHPQFTVRTEAAQQLEDLGDLAGPALREVLASKPSLEVRQRVGPLLDRLDKQLLSGEPLRTWRAIEVLEDIGTAEARQVLESLTKGIPASRTTAEARTALERLSKRARAVP